MLPRAANREMSKMSTFLFETENYGLLLGTSPFVEVEGKNPPIYIIMNKDTQSIEAEHRVLGMAISWCEGVQKSLDEAKTGKRVTDDIPAPPIPNFDKPDGDGGKPI